MYPNLYLNQHSLQLIDNIRMNAKEHPSYQGYQIIKDALSYSDAGAVAIKLISPKGPANMFLFYPSLDGSGKIGSCAIYGFQLTGHKNAIERTMTLFGLPVQSVHWDEGIERFLDVTLEDY